MNSPIAQIVTELQNQLAPIEAEENRCRTALAELKDQRQKIEAALSVLGSGSSKSKPAKAGKPCATKQEVVAIVGELLRTNRAIPIADLEALTKENLAESGDRSLSGFGLRFREALRQPEFRVSPAGVVELVEPVVCSQAG